MLLLLIDLAVDLAKINMYEVGVIAVLGLVGAILGSLFAFGNRVFSPILTAIFVTALFVAFTLWGKDFLREKNLWRDTPPAAANGQ